MTHYSLIVRLAHIGATIAALIVAIAASIGFHDMTGSWGVAILAGTGIASVLGLGWWTLISAGARARRGIARASTVIIALVLVAIALGTSGWALATAIGGERALAQYQAREIVRFEDALAAAKGRVDAQRDLEDTVRQHATATSLLADEEGRTGQGPLYRSYLRTEENLINAADGMSDQLAIGDEIHAIGVAALASATANLGDQEVVRAALVNVGNAIRELNEIDVSGDVLNMGMVGLNDRGLPELDNLTQDLRDAAEASAQEQVAVPTYVDSTRADAVLSERPVGAWVVAVAIDIAPFLFLLIVMMLPMEPLLRDEVSRRARTTDEEIRTREDNVIGIREAGE